MSPAFIESLALARASEVVKSVPLLLMSPHKHTHVVNIQLAIASEIQRATRKGAV